MYIRNRTYIAIVSMAILAHDSRTINLQVLHRLLGISNSYMEQIFSKLRQAGLTTASRGPGGGYKLSRDPQEISLADIALVFNADDDRHLHDSTELGSEMISILGSYIARKMADDTLQDIIELLPLDHIDPDALVPQKPPVSSRKVREFLDNLNEQERSDFLKNYQANNKKS